MAKSTLYNMYNDLVEAVKPIVGTKNVFLRNRPKLNDGSAPMSKFIVVKLPANINNLVKGHKKTCIYTSGVLELYTQARSNDTLDPNSTGDFVDNIDELFPIKGKYVIASNPIVRSTGSDEAGFQVVTITFDLHSRWGALEK